MGKRRGLSGGGNGRHFYGGGGIAYIDCSVGRIPQEKEPNHL